MKYILNLEYLGGLLLAVFLYSTWHLPWWWLGALFLVPDIGMLGYVFGPKVGAGCYNLFHHLGVAASVLVVGMATGNIPLKVVGSVLMAHLFFDRIFGYGLKYGDAFKHTHLDALR
jgi:hypothetical protein